MAGAGYTVDKAFTDDETFEFAVALTSAGDEPIPWDQYSADYSLTDCGRSVALLTDAPAGGIEATEIDGEQILTISAPWLRLRPGAYRHGLRLTHIETGKASQLFDGTITITEGNFR